MVSMMNPAQPRHRNDSAVRLWGFIGLAPAGCLLCEAKMGSILRLAVEALQQAIELRSPLPGLVHHSDRGIQYASSDYVALLKEHGIVPSMSRPANPYDNASCESFMKTLKREEIYANEYLDLDDLRNHIEEFIERYYNQKRLHSALNFSNRITSSIRRSRKSAVSLQPSLWSSSHASRVEPYTAPSVIRLV